MDRERLTDALDSLTRRDLEQLQEQIARRLLTCTVCGSDGADAVRLSAHGIVASLMLCKPCLEKHRLPEGRSE